MATCCFTNPAAAATAVRRCAIRAIDFRIGQSNVYLGAIEGCPFYISGPQFEYWAHTQLTIDLVPGRGAGFSVEAPEGFRFLTRSRVFTDAEFDELVRMGPPPAVPKRWKRRKLEGRPSC